MSSYDERMDWLREKAQGSPLADKLSPPETESEAIFWAGSPFDDETLNAIRLWLIAASFEMQRPQGISFPRFMEEFEHEDGIPVSAPHTFLMTHNWAAAFAGDRDFDDRASEFRLPAPLCCFDFAVSGRRVLTFIQEDQPEKVSAVVEWKPFGWFPILFWKNSLTNHGIDGPQERAGVAKLRKLLLTNIKAACIALEAELAETEIVRAPHRLNAARIRRGRLPLSDYHTINLARRQRAAPLPLDHEPEPHRSPRLHFRRGHWRHFINHKTWIKWTLVGDPDLGFIDKDYRL